jgi:protein-tyrosine-phosphatase
MAEGILRHEGGAAFEVESAGVKPSNVRPEAIRSFAEGKCRDSNDECYRFRK